MSELPDPGYGDPDAPMGSPEWAKRWRLCFQTVVKDLPRTPGRSRKYYDAGVQYRAWTLLQHPTADPVRPFKDFDEFCDYEQPWGLGMNPKKFRDYLAAEIGKEGMDLATVSPGDDKGGRPKKGEGETSATVAEVSREGQSTRKQENLRAILRAPEIVQQLYREGKIYQEDATPLGPKSPTPEQAARVAEIRQAIEQVDTTGDPAVVREAIAKVVRPMLGFAPEVVQRLCREGKIYQKDAKSLSPKSPTPEQAAKIAEICQAIEQVDTSGEPAKVRKAVGDIVRAALAIQASPPLDTLRKAWVKATPEERQTFARGFTREEWIAMWGE